MKTTTFPVLGFFLISSSLSAQVLFDGAGSYDQDFDTLPVDNGTGTNFDWSQNGPSGGDEGILGWYYNRQAEDFASDNGRSMIPSSSSSDWGTDRILSLASSDSATDVSLGLRATGSIGNEGGFFGLRLRNDSGSAISQLQIAFTGQQWYQTASAGDLTFYYFDADETTDYTAFNTQGATGMDIVNNGTEVTGLTFTALKTGSDGALDGNAAGNFSNLSETVTGLDWADGDDFWLVWHKEDASSALGIDDLSVVIPEPSAPLLVLLTGMVLLCQRRRRF